MNNELRIKATKILMNSDLTADEIADVHEAMCMTGAIEFLRKAKAICEIEGIDLEIMFNIIDCISGMDNAISEADLVRKVMDYQIKEISE